MLKVGDQVIGNDRMNVRGNRQRRGIVDRLYPNGDVDVVWALGGKGVGIGGAKFDRTHSTVPPIQDLATDVEGIGKEIIDTLTERGKQYDASGKEAERSMKKIVTAFNAITGQDLTAVQGWAFMQVLKQVRFFSNTTEPHRDSLIDNGAYALLQAEEALK